MIKMFMLIHIVNKWYKLTLHVIILLIIYFPPFGALIFHIYALLSKGRAMSRKIF